ncbi:hypothetical protein FNYG_15413 [Fusarium nygamai]|uniref:Uncharacterized protein n=1 Tax=Gibberella nygamai TaxID=42673 RepID=A0A2K0UDM9_GIBNY|nr:hypothetical protein FNYG_15413 [Fusarium nygamai]
MVPCTGPVRAGTDLFGTPEINTSNLSPSSFGFSLTTEYRIYTNIVWFFLRRNLKDNGKRLRSRRSGATAAANNGRRPRNPSNVLGSESPTPSPPEQESPYGAALVLEF